MTKMNLPVVLVLAALPMAIWAELPNAQCGQITDKEAEDVSKFISRLTRFRLNLHQGQKKLDELTKAVTLGAQKDENDDAEQETEGNRRKRAAATPSEQERTNLENIYTDCIKANTILNEGYAIGTSLYIRLGYAQKYLVKKLKELEKHMRNPNVQKRLDVALKALEQGSMLLGPEKKKAVSENDILPSLLDQLDAETAEVLTKFVRDGKGTTKDFYDTMIKLNLEKLTTLADDNRFMDIMALEGIANRIGISALKTHMEQGYPCGELYARTHACLQGFRGRMEASNKDLHRLKGKIREVIDYSTTQIQELKQSNDEEKDTEEEVSRRKRDVGETNTIEQSIDAASNEVSQLEQNSGEVQNNVDEVQETGQNIDNTVKEQSNAVEKAQALFAVVVTLVIALGIVN